jgi:hypothetical protein
VNENMNSYVVGYSVIYGINKVLRRARIITRSLKGCATFVEEIYPEESGDFAPPLMPGVPLLANRLAERDMRTRQIDKANEVLEESFAQGSGNRCSIERGNDPSFSRYLCLGRG